MSRQSELRECWPKGCQPPPGYVAWHDWAEAQKLHGLMQTQCPKCERWFFPQEAHCTADTNKLGQK